MSDNESVIKALVDSVSSTLVTLAVKYDSLQRTLDRIEQTLAARSGRYEDLVLEVDSVKDELGQVAKAIIAIQNDLTPIKSEVEKIGKHVSWVERYGKKPLLWALFILAIGGAILGVKEWVERWAPSKPPTTQTP